MIILVANTKGGVGKSTLAAHIAQHAATLGKALLIDTDRQNTAASWASWRQDRQWIDKRLDHHPRTVILFNDAVYKEGRVLAAEHANTVIDAGGRDNASMRYAMLLADKLVIPIGHSDFDTSSWTDMMQVIEMARPNNPELDVMVVLSRIDGRRRPPGDICEMLAENGIRVAETTIPERVSFVNATNEGLTVTEVGDYFRQKGLSPDEKKKEFRHDATASAAITSLMKEIFDGEA